MHGIWEVSAVRVVVVGAGTAGASAAFAARMSSRDAEVIVLGDEPQPTYSRCALPFAVAGKVSPLEKVIVFGEKQFAARRIELIKPARARALETKEHALVYEFDGDEKRLEYDTLVVATGGRATPPPVDGVDLEGNLLLRTYADAERLIEAASSGTRFVVNGASFIALEAAEALKSRGADVSLVVRSRVMRSFVDEPLSRLLADHLRAAGLRVLQGASIERVEGASRVEAVVVGDERVETDFVLHATGTRAEATLAGEAGLTLGAGGAVSVDSRLRTSAEAVFACGDCTEVEEAVAGLRVMSGLGTTATRHGMAAGANAAGGDRAATPVLSACVMHIFGLEVGSVGLTEAQARDAGLDVVASQVKYPALPHYWPENEDVVVRLLAEKDGGRLVGAQVLCERGAALRVNMLSLAIERRMSAAEVAGADFCYSPPCADVWAAEAVCAQSLVRRLEKRR